MSQDPQASSETGLSELARADWGRRVGACFQRFAGIQVPLRHVLMRPDDRTSEVTGADWGGFPVRLSSCLSRMQALELLDWQGPRGDEGRQLLQEEYLEWRTIRDDAGAITRVEMTTELPDYWRCLAAWEPARTLVFVAHFARETTVPEEDVYGNLDPFGAGVSPEDREGAFASTMLTPGASPYNDSRRAITCMIQPSNTLMGLVEIIALSAVPYAIEDQPHGGLRSASAAEIIPLLGRAAQAGRNSDPVIVERLARLALEGRVVALDDPIGVHIEAVEHTRLRRPDGSPVPPEWFKFERGAPAAREATGPRRYQRLTLEVPAPVGIKVGDLIDVATGHPVRYGGQIADLVRVAVSIRTTPPGVVGRAPQVLSPATRAPDIGCRRIRGTYDRFRASRIAGETG